MQAIQLGLDTFGAVTSTADGKALSPAETLRAIFKGAMSTVEVGEDVYCVGEHPRADYAVSSPDPVLAAIGASTKQIHVSSAVTVPSSEDPVRVYERFASLQGLTSGRAEIVVGRGAYTESFPLFGLSLDRYEELFE